MSGASTTEGTGRLSVAFPRRWWYPACQSSDLSGAPRRVVLMDRPVALFRDATGRPAAVVDRCAHRNAPLSLGRVTGDGCVECPYHGWRYDGEGRCRSVPGLMAESATRTRDVEAYPVREQDGFVWLWADPSTVPSREPFGLPRLPRRGYGRVVFPCDLDATLHAALENTLDVPHTAFLHKGIFRGTRTKELRAIRRHLADGCEVEFVGEPVGLGKIQGGPLAGKVFEHWDRFFLPSIAQVEYRVEGWLRIFNTVLHLPMSPTRTRAWFVFEWSAPAPAALLRPIVEVRGRQVLRQDAFMLSRQSEQIATFGGERFTSTDLDLLGAAIWRLLRQAERAEADPESAGHPGVAGGLDGDADGPPGESADTADREITFRA